MNRSLLRTFSTAVVAAVASLVLSACGTGFGAQTNQQYQASIGANLRTGDLHLYNALFVDNGDGTATFSASALATDDLSISVATVTPTSGSPITVTLAEPVELPADELVTFGSAGEIVVESADVTAGGYTEITLSGDGGDATLEVPVVERISDYESVARTPAEPTAAE